MTYRRVVAVVISVWVFSSCISLFVLNSILENVLDIITITSVAVCLTTTGLMRVSMGLTVRRKTAKNLAVRRKNERILAVSRKKN